MTTKICVPAILPLEKDVIKVKVPASTTLYQGNVVVAESLNGTSESIYTGALVTEPTTDLPAIVINQGVYEDTNGVRVEGYVNPGDFSYKAADVITAIRPTKDLLFKMTNDCFSGVAVKDQFLILQDNSHELVVSAVATTNSFSLKIEQLISIPVGNTFVPGVLLRVYNGR
jgi:uncharacterized UPF0146 family protein